MPGALLVQNIMCGARELMFVFMDGLYFLGQGLREEVQVPSPTLAVGMGWGVGQGCPAAVRSCPWDLALGD